MKRVFADTAYFVALVRKRDQLHRQATHLQKQPPGRLVTTEWVLAETANSLAEPPTRVEFIRLLERLRMRTDVEIVLVSHEHFQQGCELYARRDDKEWSLTDCISFVVMREQGIDAALTSDEHFEQAGFQRLMDAGPEGVRELAAPRYGACHNPISDAPHSAPAGAGSAPRPGAVVIQPRTLNLAVSPGF
jgi:predicted nucleic acid-binding protein